MSAFVFGALVAEPPPPAPTPTQASDAHSAPGRAAVGPAPTIAQDAPPAGDGRSRDGAALPTAAPAPGPAGLSVRITVPDGPFAADERVRFRVRWSDGNGRYAGLTEDWGDGTATSSVRPVSCGRDAGPHSDELTTAHRFAAGRFRVRITVVTAECNGRTESRTAEVTVDVRAHGRASGPAADRPGERRGTRSVQEGDGSGPAVTPTEPSPSPVTPTPAMTSAVPPEHLVRTAEADRTDSDTP